MAKSNKKVNPLPFEELITEVITKEKKIKQLFNSLKITPSDDSPLDISYCSEVLKIMGLPPESDLQEQHQENHDPYINDYTAMVYGDEEIPKVISRWRKKIAKVGIKYNPQDHKKEIVNFFQKEQRLYQALKSLGVVSSGPLSELVKDWNLANAVLGQEESDKLSEDLFSILEQDGDVKKLVKTWVK